MNVNRKHRALTWVMLLMTVLSFVGSRAKSQRTESQNIGGVQKSGEVAVGKPLFVSSATSVCGPLETQYPFHAATYGKVSGFSPATSAGSKIVVYTRTVDANFLRLAAALDYLVAKNKFLAGSMVIVMDRKGAQEGGYPLEELQQRRAALRKQIGEVKMGNLSFFLSAPNAQSMAPRLGLNETNNALILLVTDSGPSGNKPLVKWMKPIDTTKLDAKAIGDMATTLKAALKTTL